MMKCALLITFLLVCIPLQVSNAGTWSQVDFTGGDVSAMASYPSDQNIMLTCVDGYGVYRSTDRGINWSSVIDGDFHDISISMNDVAYAAGKPGVMFSNDRGETWEACLDVATWKVDAHRNGTVAVDTRIIEGYSTTYTPWRLSHDNGTTWEEWADTEKTVSLLFHEDGTVNRSAEGIIYRGDSGDWNKWITVWSTEFYYRPDLRFGFADGDSVLYAYSRYKDYHPAGFQQGGVFRSADSGLSWSKLTDIDSVSALERFGDTLIIGTPEGKLSIADADTDMAINIGSFGGEITAIDVRDFSDGEIIVATKGGIFRTVDGGLNWCKSDAGILHSGIVSVQVIPTGVNGERIIVTTSESGVFYSDDGGNMWEWASPDVHTTPGLLRASPITPRRIYAAGASIHVSRDDGETWDVVEPFPAGYYGWYGRSVDIDIDPRDGDRIVVNYYDHSLDHMIGIQYRDGRFDETIENEWEQWLWKDTYDFSRTFRSQFSADGDLVWVSYGWFRPPVDPLLKAINESGEVVHEVTLPSADNAHYFFINGRDIYVFSENEHRFWASPDLGVTWEYSDIELQEYIRFDDRHIAGHLGEIVMSRDEKTLYLLYPGNGLLASVDGGRTWERLDMGLNSSVVWQIDFSSVDQDVLFAATDNGLFRFEGNAGDVGIDLTAPMAFSLEENHPNPFNPSTTISFNLSTDSSVNLTVHDITGQKVGTLIDSHMQAGNHSALFDGSGMASGIYFYQLESEGFRKTGKMLLLK